MQNSPTDESSRLPDISSSSERYIFWGRLLAGNFLFQIIIQGLGFLTGLLIVRSLSKEDYAYFTIISTMAPVFNMIADNGITTGTLAIGGKIWQDDEKMGRLIRSGLHLRRRFALVSALIVTPILGWMLLHNHAPVSTAICLILLTLAGIIPQLSQGILSLVVELRQQLPEIRWTTLCGTLLRLALVLGMIGLSCATSSWAVFAGTCAVMLQNFLLTRIVRRQVPWSVPRDEAYEKEILGIVRKVAPLTIYYCVQSQISIWLISVFGNAHGVADLGAMGRFAVVFSLFTAVAGMVVTPRFARVQDPRLLKLRYAQVVGGYFFLVLAVVAFTALFPGPLLYLLGSKYTHLSDLLWLVMLAGGLSSLAGLMGGLNNSRGWIPPAIINIPLEIATMAILLMFLDISQVRGVLLLSCISIVPVIILIGCVSLHHMRKLQRESLHLEM